MKRNNNYAPFELTTECFLNIIYVWATGDLTKKIAGYMFLLTRLRETGLSTDICVYFSYETHVQ